MHNRCGILIKWCNVSWMNTRGFWSLYTVNKNFQAYLPSVFRMTAILDETKYWAIGFFHIHERLCRVNHCQCKPVQQVRDVEISTFADMMRSADARIGGDHNGTLQALYSMFSKRRVEYYPFSVCFYLRRIVNSCWTHLPSLWSPATIPIMVSESRTTPSVFGIN